MYVFDLEGAGDRTRTGDVQLGKVTGLRIQIALYHGSRSDNAQKIPLQNGQSGLKNGLGGRSVDPDVVRHEWGTPRRSAGAHTGLCLPRRLRHARSLILLWR